jgi:hypothetical protein
MTIQQECAEYGIDPTDEKYHRKPRDWQHYPRRLCNWCFSHEQDRPRVYCDLQMAKSWRIYNAGGSVGECQYCHTISAVEDLGGAPWGRVSFVCPSCVNNPPRLTLSREELVNGYRSDGCGCVEKAHPVEQAILARQGAFGE